MLIKLINRYKSIGIITGSLLITAVISFLALPFLSRLYTVENFGVYGLAISIISVVSTISSLRLDQAILIAEDSEKASLLVSGMIIASLVSFICFISLSFFKPLYFCIAVAGGVFASSVFQLFYAYNFSEGKEYYCGFLNLYRSSSLILAQLTIPLFSNSSELIYGLYVQSIFIIILSVGSAIYLFKNSNIYIGTIFNFKDFMLVNSPHALLNSFSHNMPYYFISFFLGSKAVGYYSIVERILRLPINLMSQVIRQFFIRDFSRIENNIIDRQKALKASFLMFLISTPFFLALVLLPESIYISILGDQWIGIRNYFTILAFGYWSIFCNPPVSAYIIAKRKSDWLLRFQIIEMLIKIVLALLIYFVYGQNILILISISASLITYNFLNILFVAKGNRKCVN